uniref:TSA: Wollemia nobilis Ref_Wollemi_Transcript_65_1638 transcribed RNA sequence n=1 Tax=Wollemia nobilis TaxID=56998 RepID=A0A0C9RR33_9CONI
MERANSNSRQRKITSGLRTAELFLGVKQPAAVTSDSNGEVELDETDVVWSGVYDDGEEKEEEKDKVEPQRNGKITTAWRGIGHTPAGLTAVLEDGGRREALGRFGLVRRIGGAPYEAVRDLGSVVTARIIIPPAASSSNGDEYSRSARRYHQSAPVNVPLWPKSSLHKPHGGVNGNPNLRVSENMVANDDNDDEDEERLPPHEILARDQGRSHMTTFSVYEGAGRTLRGHDLRRVRNAVWRRTGFEG